MSTLNPLEKKLFDLTLSISKKFVDLAFIARMTPFKRVRHPEDREILELKRVKKPIHIFIWYLNVLLLWAHSGYISLGLVYKILTRQFGVTTALHFTKVTCMGCNSIIQFTFIMGQSLIPTLTNSVDSINRRLMGSGVEIRRWWECIATVLPFMNIGPLILLVPAFYVIFMIIFPNDIMFILWFVPEPFRSKLVIKVLFALLEFYSVFEAFATVGFILVLSWSYFISALKWLSVLRSTSSPLDFTTKCRTFQCLYILTDVFYNPLILVLNSIMIFGIVGMTTICFFVTIMGYTLLPLEIYIMFPMFSLIFVFVIFVTYTQLGQIRNLSTKTLKGWRYQLHKEAVSEIQNSHYYAVSKSSGSRKNQSHLENEMKLRCLRKFGIRLLTTNCTLATPQRMIECVMTLFILLIEYKLHK